MPAAKKYVPVRLPEPLYEELRRIAYEEHTSLNRLLIEAAERLVAERRRRKEG